MSSGSLPPSLPPLPSHIIISISRFLPGCASKTNMINLTPKHPFLIGIDSDGCVFDTMEVKHKECFAPNVIKYFGLAGVSKYAREACDFVNLYSKSRGHQPFPALIEELEWTAARPEVLARGVKIKVPQSVRNWVAAVMGENLALNIESRGYSRRRLQPHRRARSTNSGRPGQGQELRRLPLAGRTGRQPGLAPQGDADGQGRPGGRRVHREADPAALARRRDHRRRQHASSATPSGARSTSSRRACCTSARASPAARRAR